MTLKGIRLVILKNLWLVRRDICKLKLCDWTGAAVARVELIRHVV